MQCPKCETPLAPGHVYCPKCGTEVQIVPDYDPLDEVLLEEPKNDKKQNKVQDSVDGSEKKRKKNSVSVYLTRLWKDPILRRIFYVCVGLLVCAVVAFVAYLAIRKDYDYEYQLYEGIASYEEGNWEEAVSYLKRAQSLQDEEFQDDARPLLYLARVYHELGEAELAADVMKATLKYPMEEKQALEVYEELFLILEETGKSDAINEIIASCEDSLIHKRLQSYRIERPTVNMKGGEFHYYVYLKLEAAYGTIYYTLDGSTPTEESIRYDGRIELQEGDNILTAVAINEKGIRSSELFEVYRLNFDVPVDMTNKNDTILYEEE